MLGLAFLLGASLRPIVARAADTAEAWQADLDAAAAAVVGNDDETAAVILNAALQTALALDPQGIRVALTELQLHYVYLMLDRQDAAAGAIAAAPKLDGAVTDAKLAGHADTLTKFANTYFSRWRTANASSPHKAEFLQAVVDMDRMRAIIIARFRPDDKVALATAVSEQGMAEYRSGDTDAAIATLQKAVDLWDRLHARRETLRTAGSQLAPLAEGEAMPSDLETDVGGLAPFNAQRFLALALQARARREQKAQPEAAIADYEAATARIERTIVQYADVLKDLDEGADAHFYVGFFCAAEWLLRVSRHETGLAGLLDKSREAYLAALQQYERFEGPGSKNVTATAKLLTGLLRASGDRAQAAAIEQRYLAAKPQ
jgi:hypothetical protein